MPRAPFLFFVTGLRPLKLGSIVDSNLAEVWIDQVRLVDVRDAAERALGAFGAAAGPQHLYVSYPLVNLAKIARLEGRPSDTRRLLEEAVAIRSATLPPHHPQLLEVQQELATLQ